jgi:hypothetical protein
MAYVLANPPALRHNQLAILERGKFSQRIPGREFEMLGGFVGNALREFELVGETEFFEQPGCADGARGLEEVECQGGHDNIQIVRGLEIEKGEVAC